MWIRVMLCDSPRVIGLIEDEAQLPASTLQHYASFIPHFRCTTTMVTLEEFV